MFENKTFLSQQKNIDDKSRKYKSSKLDSKKIIIKIKNYIFKSKIKIKINNIIKIIN